MFPLVDLQAIADALKSANIPGKKWWPRVVVDASAQVLVEAVRIEKLTPSLLTCNETTIELGDGGIDELIANIRAFVASESA